MITDYKNKIIQGDALTILKELPNECIDCVVTSPPYYLLRDYGVDGQLGLEATFQEYINKLRNVFVEIKRVLKKEGSIFVNISDTYAGGGYGIDTNLENTKQASNKGTMDGRLKIQQIRKINKQIISKSLMAIPARFQIMMIDNGFICRNDLIWIKVNATPESVRDRWKKAHEHIFYFVKNKKYYFDIDAIRTPHKECSLKRAQYEQGRNALGNNPSSLGDKSAKYGMPARMVKLNPKGAVPPDFFNINTNCKADETVQHYATYPLDLIIPLIKAGCPKNGIVLDPFFGSGTTAVACKQLHRNFIGIELNPDYIKIAEERIKNIPQTLF